jgi:hypothetical protein
MGTCPKTAPPGRTGPRKTFIEQSDRLLDIVPAPYHRNDVRTIDVTDKLLDWLKADAPGGGGGGHGPQLGGPFGSAPLRW